MKLSLPIVHKPTVSKWHIAQYEWQKQMEDRIERQPMKCSIVMATYNKPKLLARTIDSIAVQNPTFRYEVIVVDDGSDGTESRDVCLERKARYYRMEREPGYRNPSFARNFGYKHASGEVVICQSDDVVHETESTIDILVNSLKPGQFQLATVHNSRFTDTGLAYGKRNDYCSIYNQRPLFFLGSLYRRDLYAVGGCDESFNLAGYDDDFFANCLMDGLKLTPCYRSGASGIHQHHERPYLRGYYRAMEAVYLQRKEECAASGIWCASGGAWEYEDNRSWFDAHGDSVV